jgi:hypothetical protein
MERLKSTRFRKLVHTTECTDIGAQLPNHIRARHGLPLLADGEFKPWVKNRLTAWNKRKAKANRIPWVAIVSALVVLAAGARWRRIDRDNKRRAVAAAEATARPPAAI